MSRVRQAPKGKVLFTESSPAKACFAVIRGSVDLIMGRNGARRRMARLGPSTIFGQVALLDGGPHSGTCTVQEDALLLEMGNTDCYRLLASRSPLAHKFLAALTEGIIQALRRSERRLKRIRRHPAAKQAGSIRSDPAALARRREERAKARGA